jgi:hypothetical protein
LSDDELFRRWQVARLTEPLHRLEIRSATKADFNHNRYDLVQLALRAIDYVVGHQASLEGTVTPDELVAHLTTLARRLSPDDPARPWTQVAKLTLANLLNDGRQHEASWGGLADTDDEPARSVPYRFRLLKLLDAGQSYISASDEAVMLYLQALDVDLADREAAAKLILRRQMEAGEFERARRSAVDARRTAEGLAASLRERLDETRRDLRGVDWSVDVPGQLTAALKHITEQLEMDRHILQLADTGVVSGTEAEADACRAVIAEVRRSQDVHTRLERMVVGAIPVYLAAQEAQRFAPKNPALAVDLEADVLLPYLAAGDTADTAAAVVARRVGVALPSAWSVDSLAILLLRPPVSFERIGSRWEEPGELDEPEEHGLPADIEDTAAAVFTRCRTAPRRLSELAAAAANRADEVSDGDLLDDVIHLAAAGRYVTGGYGDDEAMSGRGLPAALDGLVAVADGAQLPGGRWAGTDLVVRRAETLEAPDEGVAAAGGVR